MSILDDAKRVVDKDRNEEYGDLRPCFKRIAALWSAYLGVDVKPQDVSHLMILMKVARLQGAPGHRDSLCDIAGYAYCSEKMTKPEIVNVKPRC